MLSAKIGADLPFFAFFGSVAPISSRFRAMASSPSSTCTMIGRDHEFDQVAEKRTLAIARRRSLRLSLRQIAHARGTIFKPALLELEVICPMAFSATASGLTMDKVRSTAMQISVGFGERRKKLANVYFIRLCWGVAPAWDCVRRFARRYRRHSKPGKPVRQVSIL